MGSQEFDLVLSKVNDIAVAVNKFPENAQGAACSGLIEALLHEPVNTTNASSTRLGVTVDDTSLINFENATKEQELHSFEWYADNYDLETISNPKFIAFVAVYYCDMATSVERVDAFDEALMKRAYDIIDRKIPKSLSAILSNAKNRDRFIETNDDGMFIPAPRARRFVKKLLDGQGE